VTDVILIHAIGHRSMISFPRNIQSTFALQGHVQMALYIPRRRFLTGLGGAAVAWSVAARAEGPAVPVIGVLSPQSPAATGDIEGLRAGLRELGYVEGQNIRFEYRWAEGNFERLPDLAAELVRLKVDVLVTVVTQASLVAKKATAMTPIVMVGVADPVGLGLITSLAHPGGNVTGTSSMAAVLAGKQLQLIKDVIPDVARVAVLWNPGNLAFQTLQVTEAKAAAKILGIELQVLEARAPNEFDAAFGAIDREGTRALIILVDPLFVINSRRLVDLSVKGHLVTVTGSRRFVDAGGLMSYGPDYYSISKLAAVYVDKILKGAKPSDLPVEQPTKFEFVLNLKTAKALGIDVPTSVLLRPTR
jgi:putative tryptophan/tyrosine transport system substrate-binding protein